MMRALLDTDVVLDLLLERQPFATEAERIWRANDAGEFDAYISAITPVNVFSIARRPRDAATARQAVSAALAGMRVCPVDRAVLQAALATPFADFEDAARHSAAIIGGLDAIIARNGADYAGAALPIFSPADFPSHLAMLPRP